MEGVVALSHGPQRLFWVWAKKLQLNKEVFNKQINILNKKYYSEAEMWRINQRINDKSMTCDKGACPEERVFLLAATSSTSLT